MTRWPTLFERYVCATPSAPVAMAIAIIPATRAVSSVVSFSGIAVSSTARRRNGEIMPRPALRKISASTAPSRRRCALKSPPTRLRLWRRCSLSAVRSGFSAGLKALAISLSIVEDSNYLNTQLPPPPGAGGGDAAGGEAGGGDAGRGDAAEG